MKKNLLVSFLVILTVVNVAALATIAYHRIGFSQHFGPPLGGPDKPRDFMKGELGLSDEQAAKFRSEFEKFKSETESIMDSIAVLRTQTVDELAKDGSNRERLDALSARIDSLQSLMQAKMIAHLLESKSVLTPEQQKKFFSLLRGWRGSGPEVPDGMGAHHVMPRFEGPR